MLGYRYDAKGVEKKVYFHINSVAEKLELKAGDEVAFGLAINQKTKEVNARQIVRTKVCSPFSNPPPGVGPRLRIVQVNTLTEREPPPSHTHSTPPRASQHSLLLETIQACPTDASYNCPTFSPWMFNWCTILRVIYDTCGGLSIPQISGGKPYAW